MSLDWIQLCILPARQSYIRQFSKIASGPKKAFSMLALVCYCCAERVETIRLSFVRSPHKSMSPYGMASEIA
jgi:hypothetical protein